SFRALGRVRSIYIEEQDLPPSVLNALHNLLHLRHIGAPIKMHTENVQPGARQFEACGGAETARRTDNQPPGRGSCFRHIYFSPLLRLPLILPIFDCRLTGGSSPRLFSIDNRQSANGNFQPLDSDSTFIAPQVLQADSDAGSRNILAELLP